ncbi:MAG: heavy metal translocating P-type ATPase [Phycisphaeraceae bacterium]|nr:MAG: heavy metal translocating P-type ATPase [Phycisphaeraceae bacterium]
MQLSFAPPSARPPAPPPRPAAVAPAREADAACTHCGLPVPPGLITPGADEQFCCGGCRALSTIARRLRDGGRASPPVPRPVLDPSLARGLAVFDEPVFAERSVMTRPDGLLEFELAIDGITCVPCVWQLERLHVALPGVIEARLNARLAVLKVTFDPARTSPGAIAREIASWGYTPLPAKDRASRGRRQAEDRRMLVRLGVAGALAGNIMIFAFALYGGEFGGIDPAHEHLFRWLSTILGVTALAWPGSVFFRSALAALKTRSVNLDVPIALALAVGAVAGVVNTVLARGESYFDSLAPLVFLLLVGRFIQHRRQRHAADAVELLFSLTPSTAVLVTPDGPRTVPADSLEPGDRVEVLAGDSLPADGTIVSGRSSIDQSLLTGESAPLSSGPGDAVLAGTVNLASPLIVEVSRAGRLTRAGQLMRLVEEASARKPDIVHFTDRVARAFLLGIIALAALTVALWLPAGTAAAVDAASSLLIVTCPCALGIAVPLVMAIAGGRGAALGTLVKGSDVFERLARPGVVFLDKTGTITQGRLEAVEHLGDPDALALAAALEAHSTHPAARAVAAAFPHGDPPVSDITQTLGGGIQGAVSDRPVAVGTEAYLASLGVTIDPRTTDAARDMARRGVSPVIVSVGGVARAIIGLADPIRPDARDAIDRLRAWGWRPRILSGDHPGVVSRVGRALGFEPLDLIGGASPEDKARAVRDAAVLGPVAMIGDGVNDAPALASATVGIAVHGGAEASLAAADAYISRPGLAPVVELFDAGRRSMRAVRWTLAGSLVYNLTAAGLAVAGLITPMIAAILMPLSSLTVLTIAVRARTFPTPGRPRRASSWK